MPRTFRPHHDHVPVVFPPHLELARFRVGTFRREISHSVEGLIYGVYFNKINNSTYLPFIRELCHQNEVKILLRIEISFVNVECGISLRNGGGGVVRAVPAPPSARGVRTAVPCVRWWKLNLAPYLRSVNTEHAEARRHGEWFGGDLHTTSYPCPSSFIFSPSLGGSRSRATDSPNLPSPTPTLPSDFDIICVAFRFSEGSIGRELTRQLAVFHPATA